MAVLHLTGYLVHPLMLSMLLLTLPVGLLDPQAFKIFPISVIAGFGPPLLYLAAAGTNTPSLRERISLLPLLVITGFGISLSTSIGVLQGMLGKGGVFTRTPKLNLGNARDGRRAVNHAYIQPVSPIVWGEIGLGIYALITVILLTPYIGWGIVPWMGLYMIGYFYIAGLNLFQHWVGAAGVRT